MRNPQKKGGTTIKNTNNSKRSGYVRLLKHGRCGVLRLLFSRMGIILISLLLQIAFLVFIFSTLERYLPYVYGVAVLLCALMVLYLLNSGGEPTWKMTWLVLTLIAPVFGILLYWYTKSELGHIALAKRLSDISKELSPTLPQNTESIEALQTVSPGAARLGDYLYRVGNYPAYNNTSVTYFPSGEAMHAALLSELKQAKSFIFMEYFCIEEGAFWGSILDVLIQKAGEGVEVRVLCDGTCEVTSLSPDYARRLKKYGIKFKLFNPLTPFLSTYYNYRDHRKITIIDGHTAFNGGINLADEYINEKKRFGHWKDTAVMLKGDAAESFSRMLQAMWWIDEKKPAIKTDIEKYLSPPPVIPTTNSGFVIPYGDRPLDEDKVGERVYMDLLNRSTDCVKIMTPYLILDSEMETALKFAAERGVQVTLILPGIPDKKPPYTLAKSHYKSLLSSGVKIYEYSPGFLHAKVFLADGREAVVGTVNLDFRSFYHHFECATYIYGSSCISDISADFDETLKKSREVTLQTVKKEKLRVKLAGYLLKLIAPLL